MYKKNFIVRKSIEKAIDKMREEQHRLKIEREKKQLQDELNAIYNYLDLDEENSFYFNNDKEMSTGDDINIVNKIKRDLLLSVNKIKNFEDLENVILDFGLILIFSLHNDMDGLFGGIKGTNLREVNNLYGQEYIKNPIYIPVINFKKRGGVMVHRYLDGNRI